MVLCSKICAVTLLFSSPLLRRRSVRRTVCRCPLPQFQRQDVSAVRAHRQLSTWMLNIQDLQNLIQLVSVGDCPSAYAELGCNYRSHGTLPFCREPRNGRSPQCLIMLPKLKFHAQGASGYSDVFFMRLISESQVDITRDSHHRKSRAYNRG